VMSNRLLIGVPVYFARGCKFDLRTVQTFLFVLFLCIPGTYALSEGVAEASQIFLRDAYVLLKLFSYG
jgi:hypothetical protein